MVAANDKVSGLAPSLNEVRAFFEVEAVQLLQYSDFLLPIHSHWTRRRFEQNAGNMITPCLKVSFNSFYITNRLMMLALHQTQTLTSASANESLKHFESAAELILTHSTRSCD
jgi:hypothetical protein